MAEQKLEGVASLTQQLLKQVEQSTKALAEEYNSFKKERDEFDAQMAELAKSNKLNEKIIELNMGGKSYITLRSTLCKPKGSLLAALFSGKYDPGVKDKDGKYFFDRPSQPFGLILDALRTDTPLQVPDDDYERERLIREIKFFKLEDYFKEELKERLFIGSKILSKKQMRILKQYLNDKSSKGWKLCYRGSDDGFTATSFHAKCNNVGETVVVIQSTNGNIFGGYCPISWCNANRYVYDNRAFLFSLVNSTGKPHKLTNTGPYAGTSYSIYDYSSYGPTFGGGHDIYIANNCNSTTSNYSNLGHSYSTSALGFSYGSTQAKSFLAGSYNFQVKEIEVFKR